MADQHRRTGRPPGKIEPATSGEDTVRSSPSPESAGAVGRGAPRPRESDRSGVDPELLDARERRQSADRKAAGPRRRTTADDVVVETADSPKAGLSRQAPDAPPPTEPG